MADYVKIEGYREGVSHWTSAGIVRTDARGIAKVTKNQRTYLEENGYELVDVAEDEAHGLVGRADGVGEGVDVGDDGSAAVAIEAHENRVATPTKAEITGKAPRTKPDRHQRD